MAYRPFHPSAADGKSKMASKFDKDLAKDIADWIQRVTGVSIPNHDANAFGDALRDGQTLCNLANKIKPGSIKKINKMKTPFMQMENIGWFSDFVREYGVQAEYGFVTVDLYEKRNIPQLLIALNSLKAKAEEKEFGL